MDCELLVLDAHVVKFPKNFTVRNNMVDKMTRNFAVECIVQGISF
jgi:hypothetical protein